MYLTRNQAGVYSASGVRIPPSPPIRQEVLIVMQQRDSLKYLNNGILLPEREIAFPKTLSQLIFADELMVIGDCCFKTQSIQESAKALRCVASNKS